MNLLRVGKKYEFRSNIKLRGKMKFRKFTVLLTFIAHLSGKSDGYAIFSLEDYQPDIYRTRYNRLLRVEESNDQIKSSGSFLIVLEKVGEIIRQYGLNDIVGLRLLHKHHPLQLGEVKVERFERRKNVASLVTSSLPVEEAKKIEALPASWMFGPNPDEILLFETSTDLAILPALSRIKDSPGLLQDMEKLLREHHMTTILSVAILKRDSLVPGEDELFVERSSETESCIFLENRDLRADEITTSWSFGGPRQQVCYTYTVCKFDPNAHYHDHFWFHQQGD